MWNGCASQCSHPAQGLTARESPALAQVTVRFFQSTSVTTAVQPSRTRWSGRLHLAAYGQRLEMIAAITIDGSL